MRRSVSVGLITLLLILVAGLTYLNNRSKPDFPPTEEEMTRMQKKAPPSKEELKSVLKPELKSKKAKEQTSKQAQELARMKAKEEARKKKKITDDNMETGWWRKQK